MKRPSGPAIVVFVVLVVLLPVLYVLSIGPAWAMVEHEVLDAEVYSQVYTPVIFAAYMTNTDDFLFPYLDWWAGTNLQEERFGPIF